MKKLLLCLIICAGLIPSVFARSSWDDDDDFDSDKIFGITPGIRLSILGLEPTLAVDIYHLEIEAACAFNTGFDGNQFGFAPSGSVAYITNPFEKGGSTAFGLEYMYLTPSYTAAMAKISEADYSGPARILGGAGTGKTVVAMHRAKQLSTKMKASGKLLFTTFTANLADDILANLKSICTAQELRKIEVTNLDAWVAKYLRERGYGVTIVYGTDLDELWKDAIERTVDAPDFPIAFYEDEWAKVVASQDAFSKELYLKATRIGRGTRLDRRKRMMIWNVFNEFMILQKTRAVRDIDTALYECRKLVEARNSDPMYQSIVVDEGQDFSTNAYKLLRALAGTEHQNDIFIVGDTHQRIYKNHAILSQCGINIRGRSSYLRINYRTTEEIRRYAFAILNGVDFDDMDGEMVAGKPCQSLTHGEVPAFMNFGTLIEEANYISKEIRSLVDAGVEEKRICVVARTHKLLGNYMSTLMQNGYRIFEIKRNKVDDASYEGVRVATMHRVKGLEFDYVFVAGMNKGIMPLSSAINHTDQASEDESITAEKCLLYVALTRAKLKTYLTGYGKKSAQSHFLCDAGFRS